MEDVTHLFSKAQKLPQPAFCSPLRILDCQIQKLQHSLEGVFKAFMVSSLKSPRRALELAPDIAELFID